MTTINKKNKISQKSRPTRPKSKVSRIFSTLGVIANVGFAIALILSAYAGHADPLDTGFATIINMTFPAWILLNLLNLALDLFFHKRLLAIPVLAIITCIGPILNFSPLNLFSREIKANERDMTFKVLTYNIMDFIDNQGKYPDGINRTLNYILSTDADIVCLQECEYLSPHTTYHVTPTQIDSLKQRYPYRYIGKQGQATLSKYPFTNINLGLNPMYSGDIAAHLVEINNQTLTLFNVHLRSLQLDQSDRDAYLELTDITSSETGTIAQITQLRDKLYKAARHRAKQARIIRAYLDKASGNAIVCGDFNDVPNCYAIRTIAGDCMSDAYADNAFGPTITFNANRFYFRIDHILYNGCFEAVDIERGDTPSSDHFPLLTTFIWNEN